MPTDLLENTGDFNPHKQDAPALWDKRIQSWIKRDTRRFGAIGFS